MEASDPHDALKDGPDTPRDILSDGSDVTDIPNRQLILRSVNLALAAQHIAQKVDELGRRVEDLHYKLDSLTDLVQRRMAVSS